jgi:hypothetical protein
VEYRLLCRFKTGTWTGDTREQVSERRVCLHLKTEREDVNRKAGKFMA